MTDKEFIEKRAQIKLLDHLLDHLCNAELSEIGRTAIKRLRTKYYQDVNETKNPGGKT
jgi:hypothetical protein